MDKLSAYVMEVFKNSYKGEVSTRSGPDHVIHVTDLLSFCPRKFALCVKEDLKYHDPQRFPSKTFFTFALGRKVQDIIISRYSKGENKLVGTFKCVICRKEFFDIIPADNKCPYCKEKTKFIYKDTRLVNDSYGYPIIGQVDMFLYYPPRYILPVEIKSIDGEEFVTLSEPHSNYAKQLGLYMWLLTHPGTRIFKETVKAVEKRLHLKFITKKGVILYASKGSKANKEIEIPEHIDNLPILTFTIQQPKLFIEDTIDSMETIAKFARSNRLPKVLCSSDLDMMARSCHVKRVCFEKKIKRRSNGKKQK